MEIRAGLPVGLAPPVKVALARAVNKMARRDASHGDLLFEPKWDGYIHCALLICGPWVPAADQLATAAPIRSGLRALTSCPKGFETA
jgi:hypothetical protein